MKLTSKQISGLITINAVYGGTAAGVLASGVVGDYSLLSSAAGVILFSIPGMIATILYMKMVACSEEDDT